MKNKEEKDLNFETTFSKFYYETPIDLPKSLEDAEEKIKNLEKEGYFKE